MAARRASSVGIIYAAESHSEIEGGGGGRGNCWRRQRGRRRGHRGRRDADDASKSPEKLAGKCIEDQQSMPPPIEIVTVNRRRCRRRQISVAGMRMLPQSASGRTYQL